MSLGPCTARHLLSPGLISALFSKACTPTAQYVLGVCVKALHSFPIASEGFTRCPSFGLYTTQRRRVLIK